MPPHKTSRAHICSAFNQCVSPPPQNHTSRCPILPRSLFSFSLNCNTNSQHPIPIPNPIHIIILIIIIIIVIHITSRGHRLHEQASLPCTSHPLNTHTHTHTHNRIHHPSCQPQLKRSVCIVSTKNKAPRAIFKSIGNN